MIIRNIVVSLLVGGCAVFGIVALVMGAMAAETAWESASWPSVPGTITSAVVHYSGGRGGPSYEPRITYRYQVYGRIFTGSEIEPGRASLSYGSAQAAVSRFFVGSHPSVYYSPARPKRAVLVPGLRVSSFSGGAVGIVALQSAPLLYLSALNNLQTPSRKHKKRSPLERILSAFGLAVFVEAAILFMWLYWC